MVFRPSMKSTGTSGIGSGSQRSGSGAMTMPSRASVFSVGCGKGMKAPTVTDGRRRYIQVRRLTARGAVNAVPLSSSAYRPCAGRCGLLRPTGRLPGTASLANSLPKPDW
jgi:hypothetical protein